MPEIGALLHDAVPPDEGEPDLVAIAYLAGRRRRRRRTARVVLGLAAVAIVTGGVAVIGGDGGRDDSVIIGDDTTTTTTTTTPSTTMDEGPTGFGAPSPGSLAGRLGARPLTSTTSFRVWPLTPEEFFEVPPDQVVVGTLAEVRPGKLWPDGVCHDTPEFEGCTDAEVLETVVDVERWLGPDGGAPGRLAVPWRLGAVPVGATAAEALAANDRAAEPYQRAAPLGSRVLVLLSAVDDGPYTWAPSAVSAIVIEDGGGVAVPHSSRAYQTTDFDDYVDRVEELLAQQPD